MTRPRSWIDGVLALLDRLPGPAWLAYAMLIALTTGIVALLRVLEGATGDPLAFVFAGLTFTPYALMHYINRAARHALEDFRPALGDLERNYDRFEEQLTRTRFSTGVAGIALALILVISGTLTAGGSWGVDPANSPLLNGVTIAFLLIFNAGLATFLLHTVGHLRTITRIHRDATNLQLWDVAPHRAFSRVTALTAAAITLPYVTVGILSVLSTSNPVVATGIVAVALVFAVVVFTGPLIGMRRRLQHERQRQLGETDRVLEKVSGDIRQRADAGDYSSAGERSDVVGSLTAERERLRKVSTWPWAADTLRALLTSLGVPVLLWLLTTVLGRVLFP